jgi:two-component sensor histidine kinase
MQWLLRIVSWRSNQPAIIRWLAVFALFGVALAARFFLGMFYGGLPALAFYPVLLIVAVLFGWKEALAVLGLSVMAGYYLFLPPGMLLQPVGWLLVGSLTVAIIGGLRALAEELAKANERMGILFQELQHRVANTLQSTVSRLEIVQKKMASNPTEATTLLQAAIQRMSATAEMHRRLHDPGVFSRGLEPTLRAVVATVIDHPSVDVTFRVDELNLSLDQMSIIAMLVIEIANNSMKHVFERSLGSRFEVTLVRLPGGRAVLKIKDDGPGARDIVDMASSDRSLGVRILQGLAAQIQGTLTAKFDQGTEVMIEFPTG